MTWLFFPFLELIFRRFESVYLKICTFLNEGATEIFDATQEVPYAYQGNEWVGYDNVRSFKLKVSLEHWMCWDCSLIPRK